MRKVEVRARIDGVRAPLAAKIRMTRDEAITYLRAILDADDPAELT